MVVEAQGQAFTTPKVTSFRCKVSTSAIDTLDSLGVATSVGTVASVVRGFLSPLARFKKPRGIVLEGHMSLRGGGVSS